MQKGVDIHPANFTILQDRQKTVLISFYQDTASKFRYAIEYERALLKLITFFKQFNLLCILTSK